MSLQEVVAGVRETVERDKLIRLSKVIDIVGMGKSWVYAEMANQRFPQCVRITPRSVAWSEKAVLQWVQARLAGVDWKPAVTKTNEVLQ